MNKKENVDNKFFLTIYNKSYSGDEVKFEITFLDKDMEMKKLLTEREKMTNDKSVLKEYERLLNEDWSVYGNCWLIKSLPGSEASWVITDTTCNAYGTEYRIKSGKESNNFVEEKVFEEKLLSGEDNIEYCNSLPHILKNLYTNFENTKDHEAIQKKFNELGKALSELNKAIKDLI